MKRLMLLTLIPVLLTAGAASAQYVDSTNNLILQAGTTWLGSEFTGDTMTGGSFGFTFERTVADGKWNVGAGINWMNAEESATIEDETGRVTYSSVPFRLLGRYNLLNGRFAANIGVGLGVHVTSRKIFEGTSDERESTRTGMSVTLPVSAAYFFDPEFFGVLTWTPAWVSSAPVRDDFWHGLSLGLGFVWGPDSE